MKRFEALVQLTNLKKQYQAISITTMGVIPDWHLLGGHGTNHLDVTGMGLAASVGLGIALGRPDRLVMVVDGDGSLLMELGILATIGKEAPPNLHHFLMVNGEYETTGGQELPPVDWLALGENFQLRPSPIIPYRLDYQGPSFYAIELEKDEPKLYPVLDLPKQVEQLRSELCRS